MTNWEMLAAIGQLAAVFIGIPSLIYLAIQSREQTKERRQSAVNALTEQWGDVAASVHDNAETAAIYLRGMQSFSDLDTVSKLVQRIKRPLRCAGVRASAPRRCVI